MTTEVSTANRTLSTSPIANAALKSGTNVTPTHTLTVISSNKISKKVTQILSLLYPGPNPSANEEDVGRSVVIEITAKSPVASKLITVVEIVKREVLARLQRGNSDGGEGEGNPEDRESGGVESRDGTDEDKTKGHAKGQVKLWQYTTLTSVPPKPKGPPPSPPKKRASTPKNPASASDAPPNGDEAMDLDDGNPRAETEESLEQDGAVSPTKRKVDDLEVDEFFETLQPSTKRLCQAAAPEKFKEPRMVPVLKVVLMWESREGLRTSGWGEQSVP